MAPLGTRGHGPVGVAQPCTHNTLPSCLLHIPYCESLAYVSYALPASSLSTDVVNNTKRKSALSNHQCAQSNTHIGTNIRTHKDKTHLQSTSTRLPFSTDWACWCSRPYLLAQPGRHLSHREYFLSANTQTHTHRHILT